MLYFFMLHSVGMCIKGVISPCHTFGVNYLAVVPSNRVAAHTQDGRTLPNLLSPNIF